jgi:hypothetical protein
VTSAQMSGLWGGADQRLMDWRGRLLTRCRSQVTSLFVTHNVASAA